MIGTGDAVRLVARRELVTKARSKAFKILLLVTGLAFVAFPLVINAVNTGPEHHKVAVTSAALGKQVRQVAASLHQHVRVTVVDDASAGRAEVSSGDVDAFAQRRGSGIDTTVKKSLPDDLRTTLSALAQRTALDRQITGLGGDPQEVAEQLSGAVVHVHAQQQDHKLGQKLAVAYGAGLLMYIILMSVGQMVAQGVVEEKSSRVVELLLATVKPWQLMAGKIVGIGALGLVQLVVPGILGVAVGIATDQLNISLSGSLGTLLWSLVWFVAGFALYSMIFAAVGAMVSRQEDLGGLMLPVMMPLVLGWVVGASTLPGNPDSTVAEVFSFIPLVSPVLMPMRWALGVAPWWQIVVSLALTVACSVALLRLAGRVYRNSVLRSGARVPWREAFRAA